MNIIGFGLNKIEAEKKDFLTEKIEINTNVEIKEIIEEKVDLLKESSVLKFEFEFSIKYTKEIANLKLKGFLVLSVEKKLAKEILKEWKSKKIEETLKIQLLNFIISKVSIKALELEEDLDLPYHLPFPKISKKQEN